MLLQRSERKGEETISQEVGRIVGKVGPSMLLTSLSESTAFFLGKHLDLQLNNIDKKTLKQICFETL